jgi:CBS domain-containing protein
MRVYDLLRAKGGRVITVKPDTRVNDVLVLMAEHNLGSVVVSTDGRDITGIMTERDVVRRLVEGTSFLARPVSEVMTAVVHTCHSGDSVRSLMETMTNQRIRHLPVVDPDGALSGIISIGDVVKSHITELEFERDQLTGYLSG